MEYRLTLFLALAAGPALAQYPAGTNAPSSPVDTWRVPPVHPAAGQEPIQKTDPKDTRTAEQKQKDEEAASQAKYVRFPPREDVFAFPNDTQLEKAVLDRLRKDEKEAGRDPFAKYKADLTFPPMPSVGGGVAYQPKTIDYPPMRVNHEPLYLVHRRLHFEEKNAERYGWDLGIIQPLVSAAYFYKDILLWPNSLASGVAYGFWDTNVGKCLPGSPTPYMLYPPGLTITGSVVEGLFITGVAFAIP